MAKSGYRRPTASSAHPAAAAPATTRKTSRSSGAAPSPGPVPATPRGATRQVRAAPLNAPFGPTSKKKKRPHQSKGLL